MKFQSEDGIPTLVEEAVSDETCCNFDPEELLPLQCVFYRTQKGRFQCNVLLLQRFLHGRVAISILKNFFLCNVFSMELEEVVFNVTNRFCNDFYMELEEAVF